MTDKWREIEPEHAREIDDALGALLAALVSLGATTGHELLMGQAAEEAIDVLDTVIAGALEIEARHALGDFDQLETVQLVVGDENDGGADDESGSTSPVAPQARELIDPMILAEFLRAAVHDLRQLGDERVRAHVGAWDALGGDDSDDEARAQWFNTRHLAAAACALTTIAKLADARELTFGFSREDMNDWQLVIMSDPGARQPRQDRP
jgi:hypothetical protein